MRKGRSREERRVRILRGADRDAVSQVAERQEVGEQTISSRRKRHGELDVADVCRLREREAENTRRNEDGCRTRSQDRCDDSDHERKW